MITNRRGFLTGLGSLLIAAPAIVRAASIMPVKAMPISLARHPLYDSDAWQKVREDFYSSMIHPPLIQHDDGSYSKLPFAWGRAQKIMAEQEARREAMNVYFGNRFAYA